MTDDRYKELMEQVGMPNSRSLLTALEQVANEVGQASARELEQTRKSLIQANKEFIVLNNNYTDIYLKMSMIGSEDFWQRLKRLFWLKEV